MANPFLRDDPNWQSLPAAPTGSQNPFLQDVPNALSSGIGQPAPTPAPMPQPDFSQMPWYQQLGMQADDIARILASDVTGGYIEPLAGMVSGEGTAAEQAKTQAARERTVPPLVAFDDIMRLMAQGGSFGFADKLAGAVSGTGTEAERARTQAARERAGSAGLVAEYGSPLLTGLGLGRLGLTTAGLVPEGLRGVGGALARVGAAVAEGAGYGALSAAGNDQDVGTGATTGAALGAVAQPVASAIGSMANKIWPRQALPYVPSTAEYKAAATPLYKQSEQAGVIFRPEGVQRLAENIKSNLAEAGYHPQLQPKVGVALDELNKISTGNVTLKGLDILRRMANAAKTDADPTTRLLGGQFVSQIDNYLENIKPGDILAGNKTEGVETLVKARNLWKMARKSETIDEAVEVATNNAGAIGAGGNIDNEIRKQFRNILNSKTRRLGWTSDELDSIRTIARGTTPQNIARLIGKLSPEGNGLGLYLNLLAGFATMGATLPVTVTGMASKWIADRATPNNVKALARIISSGGDASKVAAAYQAAERLPQAQREALARLLTVIGVTAIPPQSEPAVTPQAP